jgi:hypothetical protein
MRSPLAKVRDEALLAVGFRAQLENPLLPEEIEGERIGHAVGEIVRLPAFHILRIIAEDQSVAGLIEFDEFAANPGIGSGVAVVEVVDESLEKRLLVQEADDAKGGSANGENVHASVVIAFDDLDDFGGTANVGNAIGRSQQHSEFGFLLQAVSNHGAIAGLENVQRKVSAGKKNDVQRKKRDAIWPHRSQRI